MDLLLMQFFALSAFALFIGFTFCDGYKLHIGRKLIWFVVFTTIAISTFKKTGMYPVEKIIPIPCLLAFALGWYELKIKHKKN